MELEAHSANQFPSLMRYQKDQNIACDVANEFGVEMRWKLLPPDEIDNDKTTGDEAKVRWLRANDLAFEPKPQDEIIVVSATQTSEWNEVLIREYVPLR